MFKKCSALLLLLPCIATAQTQARFDALREKAMPLGGLGPFLEKYIGDCGDAPAARDCRTRVAQFRQEAKGKKYYTIVSEDSATMIAPGTVDSSRNEITLQLTPFFPAAGYALTHGAPKRADPHGNPILPLIILRGRVPDGWTAATVQRLASMRSLRLQLVFTPQEIWQLPKKGGGKNQGVRASLLGVLVTEGRSGETVASWTPAS